MDLRQLRYFTVVAEELHFGRAAARLHMTQPPLSMAIQNLEQDLGTGLFARNRRGVTLTPAGAAILPEARRLLAEVEALPALAQRAAAGDEGKLGLSFVSSADYSLLPPFLRRYRTRYPGVQISLQEATTDIQLELLMEGRVDAGLLIPPLPAKSRQVLDYLPVLDEPLILAAPAGTLKGRRPIWLKDAPRLPLIIFPRPIAPGLYDAILGCFEEPPAIGQEAIQMQTIVSLVSAGMGIALVPHSVGNLMRTGVEYRALRDETPVVQTGVAWRRDNASPVLRGFIDLLRKNT
jgi:DNA-binding transcriptional LysR family regulator